MGNIFSIQLQVFKTNEIVLHVLSYRSQSQIQWVTPLHASMRFCLCTLHEVLGPMQSPR